MYIEVLKYYSVHYEHKSGREWQVLKLVIVSYKAYTDIYNFENILLSKILNFFQVKK